MSKRISHADHATAGIPKQGYFVPLDPAAGDTEKFDLSQILGWAASRRVSDVLYSDGGTSNRRGEATFGTAGAIAGMPATFLFEIDVPASNPSASSYMVYIGPNGAGASGIDANAFIVYMTSAGALLVRQNGAVGTDYRILEYSGFRVAFSGQRVRAAVVFESANTTTNPKLWFNGTDITSSFTLSAIGTPPNWMPTALVTTKFLSGHNWTAGRFVPHAPILGAMTAAEVLAWTQTGRLPSWCDVGAGNAAPIYTSDFSVNTDAWVQNIGDGNLLLTGNMDAVSGVDNVLQILANGANKTVQIRRDNMLTLEERYAVEFDYYAESGAFSGTPYIGLGVFGNRHDSAGVAVVEGSWQLGQKLIFTVNSPVTSGRFALFTTSAGSATATLLSGKSIYLKNVKYRRLGPIAKWSIRSGRILPDISGNKLHAVLTNGVTPITDEFHGTVIQTALTANGELIDTAGIIPTDSVIEDVVVRNTTGNAITGFAIGMTSGADELTYRVDIPANSTVICSIKRADCAGLTAGTYTMQAATFGRVYYSATSWNSGSLNISVRYRRERGI